MTLNNLYKKCKEKIAEGYGDSEVILCIEEEEYHPLNSGFSSPANNTENIYGFLEELGIEEDDAIVLN